MIPFYVLLVFIICVVCLLVVLVKLSLLAKLLARKTPLSSHWPSNITEWEMYIIAQGCRLRNDLYCVEWDVKP